MIPATAAEPTLADLASLLPELRTACEAIFVGTPVFLAYAYGSRVWGTPRNDSDLDVGYYLIPGAESRCLPLMEDLRLAGVLSDALDCEVDLRCLGDAPLELRGRVLEEGHRIFSSDEDARVNLERDLLGRYHDYKPEFEALRELRFAAWAAANGE